MAKRGSALPFGGALVLLVLCVASLTNLAIAHGSSRGTLAALADKISIRSTKGISSTGMRFTGSTASKALASVFESEQSQSHAQSQAHVSVENAPKPPTEAQAQLDSMSATDMGKLAANGVVFNAIYGAPPLDPGHPTLILPNVQVGHPSNFFPTTKEEYMESLNTLTPPMGVDDAKKRDAIHRYTPMFARPGSANGVGPFAFLEREDRSSSSTRSTNRFVTSSSQRGQASMGGYPGAVGPTRLEVNPVYEVTELPIVNLGIATASKVQSFLRQSLQGHPDPVPRPVVESAAKEALDASAALMAGQQVPASITNRADNGPQNGPPTPPAFGQ